MFLTKRWPGVLLFGVLCWLVGTAPCTAQDNADDVKALLKQRRELLRELVGQTTALYQHARLETLLPLLQADRELLKAELDLLAEPKDRIQTIEQHKEASETLVKLAQTRVEAGRGNVISVSQARVYVLELQIELAKEKQRARK